MSLQDINRKKKLVVRSSGQIPEGTFKDLDIQLEVSCVEGITFRNCDIQGQKTAFRNCTFEKCGQVEGTIMDECIFTDCQDVTVVEGYMRQRSSKRIWTLYLRDTIAENCIFDEIRCDCGESIIALEDSKLFQCAFTDVILSEHSYLIEAVGSSAVTKCRFFDCSTDREDLKLIHCEEQTGKIFKRKREIDITEQCVGLDEVKLG